MDTTLNVTSTEIAEELYNETLDRNKNFDLNLNNISYYNELKKTQELTSEFLNKLIEQMIVLASGGHRVILETFDEEELRDYLFDELLKKGSSNELLNDLCAMYYDITLTHCAFSSIIKKNNIFENIEIENMVKEME